MFKTGLGLLLAGFLFGDGLGLLGLAWVMFRDRHKGRVFWFLSSMYLSFALYMILWVSAAAEVPADVRTLAYRRGVLAAATVLALGVWPAVLHVIFGFWRKADDTSVLSSGSLPAEWWIERIAQIVRDEQLTPEEVKEALRGELKEFFKSGAKR